MRLMAALTTYGLTLLSTFEYDEIEWHATHRGERMPQAYG
jgi:hypothetical protein